jgi:predicted ABC-type ATPase
MSFPSTPTCWIIAGPNGAGKTTFALEYLPAVAHCYNFINADLIAAGLSPLAPEAELLAASRLFLQEIESRVQSRQNFAFETTLAGRSHLRLIQRLRSQGWRVELIYLALPSIEMSRLRVAERVAHGGHTIPIKDVERRFSRSIKNLLNEFSYAVDRTQCFMNDSNLPQLIFEQERETRRIIDPQLFELLNQETKQ